MALWSLIVLLGACSSHWTTAIGVGHGQYSLTFHSGILQKAILVDLDLSGLNLTKIDNKAFHHFPSLKHLNLANNKLETLPSQIFSGLRHLETISLANNKLKWLSLDFVGLPNLKRFDISNNSIASLVKGDLFGLPESTGVIVEGNEYMAISSNVFEDPFFPDCNFDRTWDGWNDGLDEDNSTKAPEFDRLEVKLCQSDDGTVKSVNEIEQHEILGDCLSLAVSLGKDELNLSRLKLQTFQREWYNVSGYTISGLDLSRNAITNITPELLNDLPPSLSSINLEGNFVSEIRKNIIENRYLEILNVASCSISTIEDGALRKTNLASLLAENNKLESLDFARTLPTTLQKLVLRGNKIIDIPMDAFRGLGGLRTLDLSYNQLEKIEPGTFGIQEKLTKLILSGNRISELDPRLFEGLKMVKRIYLDNNKIKKIAYNTFLHLKSSVNLYLSLGYNEIDTLEKGTFADMAFSDLHLQFNKISEDSLPKGTFNSTTLRTLNLGGNLIKRIDRELFYGISTWDLLLQNNKIERIARKTFKYSKILHLLDLQGNPIERLKNSALYAIETKKQVVILLGPTVKVIRGGVFNDVSGQRKTERIEYPMYIH